jgi:hypothetical protein
MGVENTHSHCVHFFAIVRKSLHVDHEARQRINNCCRAALLANKAGEKVCVVVHHQVVFMVKSFR